MLAAPLILYSLLAETPDESFLALLLGFLLSEAWRAPAAVMARQVWTLISIRYLSLSSSSSPDVSCLLFLGVWLPPRWDRRQRLCIYASVTWSGGWVPWEWL